MGLLLFVYSLSAITQTNKQRNKQGSNILFQWYTISRSAYNTILQYLKYSDHNDDNNIDYKIYLHREPCTQCKKMAHKENLNQTQNMF